MECNSRIALCNKCGVGGRGGLGSTLTLATHGGVTTICKGNSKKRNRRGEGAFIERERKRTVEAAWLGCTRTGTRGVNEHLCLQLSTVGRWWCCKVVGLQENEMWWQALLLATLRELGGGDVK